MRINKKMLNYKFSKRPRAKLCCEYRRSKFNIESGCGMRASYNRFWNYCPYCGKPIAVLFKSDDLEGKYANKKV